MRIAPRTAAFGAMALLVLASGCSSLRYKGTKELWAEGDAHFDKGEYESALPYYDELVRRNEEDKKALLMRGLSHERTAKVEPALSDLAASGKQGEVRALLYRANLNIERGDLAAAEEDLGKLRDQKLTPRDLTVQMTLLGTLRLKQGKHRLAVQSFERAIQTGRDVLDARRHVADAHHNAAEAYYHLGQFQRAYEHFQAFVGAEPGAERTSESAALSGRDYYMLGLLAYLNHDYEAAEAHLSKADPDLVAQARKILDDPSFGAPKGGLK